MGGQIWMLIDNLGLPSLQVATIKETGNVEVFKRLGFAVIEERISERFLGQHGQPVTEVTLKRNLNVRHSAKKVTIGTRQAKIKT